MIEYLIVSDSTGAISPSLDTTTMNIAGIVPLEQKAEYLRTLPAIRQRCEQVHQLGKEGKLEFFDYHPKKEADVAAFCIDLMKVRKHLVSPGAVMFNSWFLGVPARFQGRFLICKPWR